MRHYVEDGKVRVVVVDGQGLLVMVAALLRKTISRPRWRLIYFHWEGSFQFHVDCCCPIIRV
jgi:hypothetical protein